MDRYELQLLISKSLHTVAGSGVVEIRAPSQEVWHIECIQTTIRQVEYYRDTNFVRSSDEHFQNIIRRSTQISEVGEKERSKFFNILREKIEDSRKRT